MGHRDLAVLLEGRGGWEDLVLARIGAEASGGIPAMGGAGRHEREGEAVQEVQGRERGPTEARESSGDVLYGGGVDAPWAASMDTLSELCRGGRREVQEGPDTLPCLGRRGDLGGHHPATQGRLMPLAWVSYSAGEHCSVLQSTSSACTGIV